MINISWKINKDFAVDLCMLYTYRSLFDGIDFFGFHIEWDRYVGDHKPSFEVWLTIFNFCLIDFEVYNIHHMEIDDGDKI